MKFFLNHTQAIDEHLKKISKDYPECKNFLDLGCGRGQRSVFFILQGRTVTGIDLDDHKTPQLAKIRYLKRDIFKNGFPDESFDMVYSFDVIEHLENPEDLMKEKYRLLKKGGICIVSTPNRYRLTNAPLVWLGIRKYPYCIDERFRDDYPNYWHLTEFSTQDLYKLAKKNGFTLEKHYKVFYGLPARVGITSLWGLPFYHNHILVLRKQ